MHSDNGNPELSSSDEDESNNNSSLRRSSVESDGESDLSEYSDDAAVSPTHSRSSSGTSDTEAKSKVEAFRRSLHELDRADAAIDHDIDDTYDERREDEEGMEEGGEDVMVRSPSSPVQTHLRSMSELPDNVSPSHNVEPADEWDDDDPPLSAYMNSPLRNNGRMSADASAENPLLQSIKRVDTNLRRIERLSLELFHDDDEEFIFDDDDDDDNDDFGADYVARKANAIAVHDKFLASLRSSLRRNIARLLFESLFFVFAYFVCSPFLVRIVNQRIIMAFGLVMTVINQLNQNTRIVWPKDSTELPGWYPINSIGQLVRKSFSQNDEGECLGLYNGLALHAPYAKTRLGSKSMFASPSPSSQYTLQHSLPQSSLRNSFVLSPEVQHHHHQFTCDHCLQKLEFVQEPVDNGAFQGDTVVRMARYEQMPGRRSRRMSV